MRAKALEAKLRMEAGAGLHEYRNYLGMSGIGGCPREQYFRMTDPEPSDQRLQWYGWTGYLHEAGVKCLLGRERDGVLTFLGARGLGRELVADFDGRYRGHVDVELSDGTLVEVKTTGWRKLLQQIKKERAKPRHYDQVQAYLKHGPYARAVVVYVARDIPHMSFYKQGGWLPPFWCVDVEPWPARQEMLDQKAKAILKAVDGGKPPDCACRWCKR